MITRNTKTIITGDFNCRHEDFGHDKADKAGNDLVALTNKHNYTKLNDNQPTYTNDLSGKQDVKDLIFCSPELFKSFKEFWVDEDLGSDHNIIIANFTHDRKEYHIPPKQIKLYHKANWDEINNKLTIEMQHKQISNKSTCRDCDNSIAHLTKSINTLIENNVKTITIKPDKIGLKEETINLIKTKRRYRKLYQRTHIKYYKTQYNIISKQIKTNIKIEQKTAWAAKCNELDIDNNQQNTWKKIKEIMGTNNKGVKIPTLVTTHEGKTYKAKTPEDKLKVMTKTLENIFTHDNPKEYFDETHRKNIEKELNTHYKSLLQPTKIPQNADLTTSAHHITKQEIETQIDTLNTKKGNRSR